MWTSICIEEKSTKIFSQAGISIFMTELKRRNFCNLAPDPNSGHVGDLQGNALKVARTACHFANLWSRLNDVNFTSEVPIPSVPLGECCPHACDVDAWVGKVNLYVGNKAKCEIGERVKHEFNKIKDSQNRSYAEAFRRVRTPLAPPTAAVTGKRGQLEFGPTEMHELISDFWVKQIFRKIDLEAVPSWAEFRDRFIDSLGPQRAPFAIPSITGGRLRNRCMKASGTHGLDGWTLEELEKLPPEWWDELAKIFDLVEKGGDWPEGLAQAAVPLIPKEVGKTDPDQQRPITVLPVLYRAWAGLRYDDLAEWQAQWAEDVMFGGLTEKEAVQAALEVTLDVEMALLEGSVLIAALLDYSKVFDMLPWEILWPLARWWGAPDEVVTAMENFYKQLKSRFKIGSHFGGSGLEPTAWRRGVHCRSCGLTCWLPLGSR
jgi:hypothetical protein